jgi:hypothetical protein
MGRIPADFFISPDDGVADKVGWHELILAFPVRFLGKIAKKIFRYLGHRRNCRKRLEKIRKRSGK